MYHLAKRHFKKADPILYAAAARHSIGDIRRSRTVFRDIVRAIVGQQLSGTAARTIFNRLAAAASKDGKEAGITPQAILRLSVPRLRACGLSGAKTLALQELSRAVIGKKFDPRTIHAHQDATVIELLTSVKGIGPWTAEMILMFSLGRTDIFSKGDLGLRKGIMRLYGLKKMPTDRQMDRLARAWSPYRTYAARVLWRVADEGK